MIRYVHIGDQINEDADEFAFFDTVADRFISIANADTFDSRHDFEEAARIQGLTAAALSRLRGLMPPPFDPLTCPPAQLVGLVAEMRDGAGFQIAHYEPSTGGMLFSDAGHRFIAVREQFAAVWTPGRDGREVWRRP